KAVANFATM
nr:Chain C, Pre-glycoprotein polyprotein GP complex [Lymphocytic choriomeningitis virus (strain WE)]3QUK_F Chain F, Pre-glycoprotein polyprotein GP complex [Lymphocytic choriomeningitis virus (strain WE)]5M00_P Chain P, LCMV-DERIVED GP33 ALTERED PEPTIDE LIGAND Y4A [Mus musculus]